MNFFLKKIKLANFRNYKKGEFNFSQPISLIYGENGVGKTNLIEAISLLSKNNLRKDSYADLINKAEDNSHFAIYGEAIADKVPEILSIFYNKDQNQKSFYINGGKSEEVYLSSIHLTPQMDDIFIGTKDARRRFLDNMVCDIDNSHQKRLITYQKLLKERLKILQKYQNPANAWIDSVEEKIAQYGVLIAASRNNLAQYLNDISSGLESIFLKSEMKILGEIEDMLQQKKAIDVEIFFINKLHETREFSLHSGRTKFGVHLSDFTSISKKNNLEAKFCSTGEQKSMLISIVLSRVELLKFLNPLSSSLLLLDEIASHLDSNKLFGLLEEVQKTNVQCFITGVSKDSYRKFFDQYNNIETIKL